MGIVFSRHWGMPSADTFDCPPIEGFVKKYIMASKVSIDPFSRNKRWCTYTNDLNPETSAQEHMDAEDFCWMLANRGVLADLVIVDPPYSSRQVKECYDSIGLKITESDTQLAHFHKKLRLAINSVISAGGVVLTFGWNTVGMGNGFEIEEIALVCHGSHHNDTICMAERKLANPQIGLRL